MANNVIKKKYIIIQILIMGILISCVESIRHDHVQHALQSQKYIVEAIYLEDRLHIDKYNKQYLKLMKQAINESKLVKKGELNGIYKDWGNMFQDYLINGAQLTLEGYSEKKPSISIKQLSQATDYINTYIDWYNNNRTSIKDNLQKLEGLPFEKDTLF